MGRAYKGSQLNIQDAVTSRQRDLCSAIAQVHPDLAGKRLTWVSPLATQAYKEYYDGPFLDALGLASHRPALKTFWPVGGPHWDALATTDEGGAILLEAKAHLGETPRHDACGAADPRSIALIEGSLRRVRAALGVPETASPWTKEHYQVANRIAHLWWLHVDRGVPCWLVFLGFTGSRDWPDPFSVISWKEHMNDIFRQMGLPPDHPLSDRIGVATMPAG